MEFKGWVTDYSNGNLQGITDDEDAKLLSDLERMVPHNAQKWIECDQAKKEQGTCPRKIMVRMWFKHETNLVTMIDLLDKAAYKINGQNVKARLEVSLQRRPLTKAAAFFFNGLKEMQDDKSKVKTFLGNLQISFFV